MRRAAFAVVLASLVASPARAPAQTAPGADEQAFSTAFRAYHAALAARKLGAPDIVGTRPIADAVAEAEGLASAGRLDEAIARLGALVEHPRFAAYAETEEARAAVFRLGDVLATAGIDDTARAYLRRVLATKDAWAGHGVWARRAVSRLVDVALESGEFAGVAQDLATVPPNAPEAVRGEIAYLTGRAEEAAGDPARALAAYASVTQRCRFWAEATYLAALIDVERGDYRDAENLLCKVADPARSAATTPVFADEKFFAVRDLARLGLGRIAHEEGRHDDARYYYYLVPQDSGRLAEALYEAATTLYEKKDYDGAASLLDELGRLGVHHRYEDEAWVLGAWVDLARCRFDQADAELREFAARYGPVRDAARVLARSDDAARRVLAAARSGADAGGEEVGGVRPEVLRAVAALVRLDPAYDRVVRRRAVLDREASGLVHALAVVGDMQRALATSGAVRPATTEAADAVDRAREAREAVAGVDRRIAALEAAGAPADRTASLRSDLTAIRARLDGGPVVAVAAPLPGRTSSGAGLTELLGADAAFGAALAPRIAAVRAQLDARATSLARDALVRLDRRLSRLLRRARLGRIETVLGRKRALEVEVEAIRMGYLPREAVDSLDAAQYLDDREEYWPFEGDDWPDEYVGSEVK